MRLLVTGCRDWLDDSTVRGALWCEFKREKELVLHVGDCGTGADAFALDWARDTAREHAGLTFKVYRADWELHGRGAGPKRNEAMVRALVYQPEPGEVVRALAFWDGMSKGTLDCLTRCVKAGVEVRVVPKDRQFVGAPLVEWGATHRGL